MNSSLIKKNDGCSMGDPVSAVFSDIYVCKMEVSVVSVVSVVPAKPVFCWWHIHTQKEKCWWWIIPEFE